MSDETNLIIDLDKLDSLSPLGENEYIWRDAILSMKDRIISAVKDNVKAINRQHEFNGYDTDFPLAQPPCFFINGGRGSGKSTLLRGLRRELLNNHFVGGCRMDNLAHIDPSELAEGESFFIYVLSCIAKKLEKSISNGCSYGEDARRQSITNAQEIIQKMAQGLKLLQNVDQSLYQSEDADFFVEDSIAKCGSSRDLKNKFYELTDELHKICGCDVFLVTIDDADLNFFKCYHILETVRKYMISPRMVFVFAGDIKLYSHICRDAHIQNFDTKTLQYDNLRKDQRRHLMDSLEEQYILKIFPGYNRVNLSPFGELLYGRLRNAVMVRNSSGDSREDKESIPLFIRRCLGYIYPYKIHPFIEEIFCEQSTRSMLQLIRIWSNSIPINNQNENIDDIVYNRKIINGILEGIRDVFSQILMRKNVDFSTSRYPRTKLLVREILLCSADLVASTEKIDLSPTHGDLYDRIVTLYLNAASARFMSHYSLILAYTLYLYPQITIARTNTSRANDSMDADTLKGKFSQQYAIVENLDFGRYGSWITSYFAPNIKSGSTRGKRYGKGVIRLMKSSRKLDEGGSKRLSLDAFITELSSKISTESLGIGLRFLLAIYHSICIIEIDKESYYYLSVYCYYGLISNILNKVKDYGDGYTEEELEKDLSMDNSFYYMQQSDPLSDDFNDENGNIADYKELFENAYKKCEKAKHDLFVEILEWAKKYQKITNMCYPADIDLAWKSFMSRCERATKRASLKPTDSNFVKAGDLFVRYINAMKNAFVDHLGSSVRKKTQNSAADGNVPTTLGEELEACLEAFPLWTPFSNYSDKEDNEYTDLWRTVDQLNVGASDEKAEPGEAEEPSEQSTPTSGKSQEDAAEEAPNPSGQGQPDGQPETEPRARRTRRRNARSSAETQTPDAGNDKSPKTVRELVNGETPENPQ